MPTAGSTTVLPFIRLDFQAFDPSFILSILSTLQFGGSRVLSNPFQMANDFIKTKPTHLGATPVFWNGLFQEFMVQVSNSLESPTGAKKKREEIEIEVSQQIRQRLGNRLCVATSGGAP